MNFNRRKVLGAIAAGAVAAPWALHPAHAQAYPGKPIKLIVGFTAGGAGDLVARMLAQSLEKSLGVPVVVENRPGASGITAAGQVARMPADGYSLYLASDGNTSIALATRGERLTYSPLSDFDPIYQVVSFPLVLVVNRDLPVENVEALIAYAKRHPGQLNYASWGVGSTSNLTGELFCQQADVDIQHVAYKGSAAAVTDLHGGRVHMMFDSVASAAPQVQAGAVRAIGMSSAERVAALPNVPAIAEAGLPGFAGGGFMGLVAPAGTPGAVIDRLSQACSVFTADPEFRAKLVASGLVPVDTSDPTRFKEFLIADVARYSKLVRDRGLVFE